MFTFILVDYKREPLVKGDGAVPIVINFLLGEEIFQL